MHSLILASAFLLIFTVQQGSSVRCYYCNSHSDPGCDLDQPPEKYLKECTEILTKEQQKKGFNYCRKITQIIEFSVNNLPADNRVIRSCGYENQTNKNYCYQRAGFGGRQIVCSCEIDGCNSAVTLLDSSILYKNILIAILILLSATIFLRKV